MSKNAIERRLAPIVPALAVVLGAVLLTAGQASASDSDSGPALVANSVCEAQELKALQAQDPSIEIEIPADFNKMWPTLSACRSHAAAEDPEAPGPLQPIQFSHKHHAGEYEIECLYCHSGTDKSRMAGVPSVETCMGCHSQFSKEYDELEGIQTLKQHWEEQTPIEWEQIHRLPEHVKFRHNRHVQAGFDCQTCHGPVEEMDKVYMTEDTHWWPWMLPTQKLEMGWCINCHRENEASQDCYTCHY
jgi:hypothetical protein